MIKTIPIFLPNDRVGWITAGPTREMPEGYQLIRCAAEIPVDPDRVAFDIATKDFSPFDDDTVLEHLNEMVDSLAAGTKLYAGCMGGTGRTGTILAILAAQHPGMTGPAAIDYIRGIYKPHAVETAAQEEQVARLAQRYGKVFYGPYTVPHDMPYDDVDYDHDWNPPPAKLSWWKRLLRIG
jgi:hypothetical protein